MTRSEMAFAFSAKGGRVQKGIFEGATKFRTKSSRRLYHRLCWKAARRAAKIIARTSDD